MAEPGVCSIKPEFLLAKPLPSTDNSNNQEDLLKDQLDTSKDDEPSAKKFKAEDKQTKRQKKNKGQNKVRPKTFREENVVIPCPTIIDIREGDMAGACNFKQNCQYVHDALQYLSSKPDDIGKECHVFNLRGHCSRGLSCRFGAAHLTADGKNIVNDAVAKDWKEDTINSLPQNLFYDLQKRKYDFSPYENLVRKLDQRNVNKNSKSDKNGMVTVANGSDETKNSVSGAVTDEDIIKLLPRERKTIDWKDKLYLAPLTTVGNLPFRRICKSYGADITCGEMALCESLLKGMKQEWALLKRHSSEDLFGVQICGNNAYTITKVAHLIRENHQVDFVDLNLGCPIELIYQKGGGCGMLHRLPALEASIRCASQLLHVPFTVKTRTGVYQDKKIAHNHVSKFHNWGASMITVHGRSREARYSRLADWEYIETCAQAAAPCPVFGSGDVLSYQDYVDRRNLAPSVQGVMIGRGALIKPWIFTEIKEQKLWDISSSERFDILKKYTNYGLEHWGSDTRGVENTRRFLLEWLSFLYRYIPVGLLERPPQRINQRPPLYFGRDDMETLMASGNCADWIKISEMLLGPVPNGFQFLPKHKANSYK